MTCLFDCTATLAQIYDTLGRCGGKLLSNEMYLKMQTQLLFCLAQSESPSSFDQTFVELGCLTDGEGSSRQIEIIKTIAPNGDISVRYAEADGTPIEPIEADTITLGTCPSPRISTSQGVVEYYTDTGAGIVTAGKQSVSIACISGTTATVQGATIIAGQTVSFEAYFDYAQNEFIRVPQIDYDADGNVLSIATMG